MMSSASVFSFSFAPSSVWIALFAVFPDFVESMASSLAHSMCLTCSDVVFVAPVYLILFSSGVLSPACWNSFVGGFYQIRAINSLVWVVRLTMSLDSTVKLKHLMTHPFNDLLLNGADLVFVPTFRIFQSFAFRNCTVKFCIVFDAFFRCAFWEPLRSRYWLVTCNFFPPRLFAQIDLLFWQFLVVFFVSVWGRRCEGQCFSIEVLGAVVRIKRILQVMVVQLFL